MGFQHAFQALYALTGDITARGASIKLYNYDALPASVPSTNLPVRMLLPFDDAEAGSTQFKRLTYGATPQASSGWRIADVMLIRPKAQGQYSDTVKTEVDYVDTYLNSILTHFVEFTERGLLPVGITPSVVQYEYPPLSDVWYWGVMVIVEFSEVATRGVS